MLMFANALDVGVIGVSAYMAWRAITRGPAFFAIVWAFVVMQAIVQLLS